MQHHLQYSMNKREHSLPHPSNIRRAHQKSPADAPSNFEMINVNICDAKVCACVCVYQLENVSSFQQFKFDGAVTHIWSRSVAAKLGVICDFVNNTVLSKCIAQNSVDGVVALSLTLFLFVCHCSSICSTNKNILPYGSTFGSCWTIPCRVPTFIYRFTIAPSKLWQLHHLNIFFFLSLHPSTVHDTQTTT